MKSFESNIEFVLSMYLNLIFSNSTEWQKLESFYLFPSLAWIQILYFVKFMPILKKIQTTNVATVSRLKLKNCFLKLDLHVTELQ